MSHQALSLLNFGGRARLPMLRQTEITECGLACIAMLASYHGHHCTVSELRHRFPGSHRGSSVRQLGEMAATLGLNSRALRAELVSLRKLVLPCILHWDMNHYIVLKRVGAQKIVIHDPACGERHIDLKEVARRFTGVAIEVTPDTQFKPRQAGPTLSLSSLYSRAQGLRRSLLIIFFLSMLLQVFALAAPYYVQTVVDEVILRQDTQLLQVLATGFGLLLLVEIGTQALRSFFVLHFSSLLNFQLARNLQRHLLHLPMTYFSRRQLGDIASRFSSVDAIKDVLSVGLVGALVDGLMAVLTLIAMFIYDLTLGFIVSAAVLAHLLLRLSSYRYIYQLNEEGILASASCESHLLESIRAIQTIKLFQREADRRQNWEQRFAAYINKDIAVNRWEIVLSGVTRLVFGCEHILVVFVAARAIMEGELSLGMFFAFMSYKTRFSEAARGFIEQVIALKMLGVHLERISDIAFTHTDSCTDPISQANPQLKPNLRAAIEVRGLGYSYGEATSPVFCDLSFQIPPGRCTVITGDSGSGKSTLLKCLAGLLPVTGEITFNGQIIHNCPDYRQRIGTVMQDDYLLSGSIAENISCFDPQVDMERIVSSAMRACVHTDILRLPMRYNTPVGDLGSGLSGGQAQRIMLARALYRRPDILMLDEATCHLDIGTESSINQQLDDLKITRIHVAHRPETIARADYVLRLCPDGRIQNSRDDA